MDFEELDCIFSARVRMVRLFERYGALLTDKQQQACEMVLMDDWSFAEAANAVGVTRQGIFDMVKRACEHMEEADAALKLLEEDEQRHWAVEGVLRKHESKLPADFVHELRCILQEVTGHV